MKAIICILILFAVALSSLATQEYRREKHIKRHFGNTTRYSLLYGLLTVTCMSASIILVLTT